MKVDRKQAIVDASIFKTVLRDLFPGIKETEDDQILVKCCFHDDTNPSLSVNTVTGLYNCFACGAAGNGFDLFMKVKSVDFKTAITTLEKIAGIGSRPGRSSEVTVFPKVVATYYYHDANGERLYWKKRYEPGFGKSGRSKSFAFYHDVDGKEKKGRGRDTVLYNLHFLAKAEKGEPFFILEGEAKCDVLTSWDLLATTLDSGGQSGKRSSWQKGFEKYFKHREVFILPDNDKTGETYATTIADKLLAVAKSVKILRLPDLPPKGDIIDWIKNNKEQV